MWAPSEIWCGALAYKMRILSLVRIIRQVSYTGTHLISAGMLLFFMSLFFAWVYDLWSTPTVTNELSLSVQSGDATQCILNPPLSPVENANSIDVINQIQSSEAGKRFVEWAFSSSMGDLLFQDVTATNFVVASETAHQMPRCITIALAKQPSRTDIKFDPNSDEAVNYLSSADAKNRLRINGDIELYIELLFVYDNAQTVLRPVLRQMHWSPGGWYEKHRRQIDIVLTYEHVLTQKSSEWLVVRGARSHQFESILAGGRFVGAYPWRQTFFSQGQDGEQPSRAINIGALIKVARN